MSWSWHRAGGQHIDPIVGIAKRHFETEADTVFRTDPVEYARNIGLAIVNQFYNPYAELVMVAEAAGRIVAYVWARRGERAPWSSEEMVAIRIAHVDMTLSARDRIRLVQEMIGFWEVWAVECGIPIVCSTTMRRSQDGFLKIHARLGYDVRGSIAYKRLT
jgi:hypothetical protein